MNNLIPERRTDKNGVTSTKWVRPSTNTTAIKSLPAPALTASTPESLAVESLFELLAIGYDIDSYPGTARNVRYLAERAPFLLDQIMQNARDTDSEGLAALGKLMMENPLPNDITVDANSGAVVKAFIHYYRIGRNLALSSRLGITDRLWDFTAITESAVGMSYWDRDISRGQAVMIINKVTSHPIYDVVDHQKDDIDFISRNLDKVIPLIPSLLQRKAASRGIIEALWDSEHSSLNDGIL